MWPFKKQAWEKRWPNFTRDELACPCCGECHMDEDFLDKLQLARTILNEPIHVRSGYRCEEYNRKVSGDRTTGRHPRGEAIDAVTGHDAGRRGRLIVACVKAGLVSWALTPNRAGLHIDASPYGWLGLE